MAISDDLNSIRTHLEDDYEALEQLGVSVEDRNIENIKDMANQIYAKFPKTSYAEGSNITLSNTLKGKLDFEEDEDGKKKIGYGQTEQKSYEGYNLWGGFNDYNANNLFVTKSDGTILVNLNNQQGSSATTVIAIPNGLLKTLPAGTYTFSVVGLVKNLVADVVKRTPSTTSGQVIREIRYGEPASGQFTLTEDSEVFARLNTSGIVNLNGIVYLQIEKGSTAHNWEPYVGGTASPNPSYPQEIEVVRGTQTVYIKDENNNIIDTKTINLGEYEFARIGNYVDTIEYDVDEDKVYKNKAIGKVVFNGSETGWERNTTTLGYRYRINQLDIKPNADNGTIASIYCNYLRATSPDRLYNDDNYSISCFSGTSHVIIIACIDTDTDTLEKWKTWLSTHNLEVYYVLAEATKEEITGTLKDQIKALYNSQSFTGTTIIEIDGQLPLIIKVRALKGN